MIMSCSCGRVASGPMPTSQAHAAYAAPTATIAEPTTSGARAPASPGLTERVLRSVRRPRARRRATAAAPIATVPTRSATGPNGRPTGATTTATTPATATDAAGASATMSSPGGTDSAASSTNPGR